MEDDEELRMKEVADPSCNSSVSDIEPMEISDYPKFDAAEHDRFIPTRNA